MSEVDERVCYSDECAEPCQSYQYRLRAELAEYKALSEKAGRRLGETRAELARYKAFADEVRDRAAEPGIWLSGLELRDAHRKHLGDS